MVTATCIGSLGRQGNTMFQIAAVIGYARMYNMDYVIPNWQYAQHFQGPFNQSDKIRRMPTVKEKSFSYQRILKYNDADLFGYFQSIKYWKHCEEEIRKIFKPNDSIQKIIEKQNDFSKINSCSIHVRRTDYLQLKDYHPSLPLDYYTKAIEQAKADLYIVFSDDIEWCKENIKGENFIYFQSGIDILDWFVASTCKQHIIANSSFSWWYSFLSEREGKTIYAPDKSMWFGPKYEDKKVDDLYLPEWNLIETI